MAMLLSLTLVLLSSVSTSAASTVCPNGKCDITNDGDEEVLLQGRVRVSAMEAVDAVKPFKVQLTQAEEDVHKRLAARKPLLIEQDLSKLHKSHYAKLNRKSKNIYDALMEAFEAFVASSNIGSELTEEELTNFAARFEEDAEILLKHAGVSAEALEADLQDGHIDEITDDVWQALVSQALEREKPVCPLQYEESINSAQSNFQISCAGIGNLSKADARKVLGKKQDNQTASLIETGGTYSTPNYEHMFDSSATPPPELDARTAFPDCSSVTGRVHNQGTCGSCWVFGALASLDSRICIKTGGAFSGDNALLSRGYTTSCAKSNGCRGGLSRIAYELFRTNGGGVTGGDNGCSPYFGHGSGLDHFDASAGAPACPTQCGNSGYFRGMASDKFNMPSLAYSEVFRGASNFQQTLQQAISQNGPVPYGIYCNDAFFGYRSGIFSGDCNAGANHEVVAIGYGSDYVLSLNSWGAGWGDQGSFKATYCTVTDFTLTSFTETAGNFPSPLFAGGSGGGGGGSTGAPTSSTVAPTTSTTTTTEASTCPGPWCVSSGPCVRNQDGCVTSPNWDGQTGQYGNREQCTFLIDAVNTSPIEVVDWNVERNYDKLIVNGEEYDGTRSSDAPVVSMTWTSDYSVVNTGWKICPRNEPTPSTAAPSTAAPSTAAPATPAPSTAAPWTAAPSTAAPWTPAPSTAAPVTPAPPPNSSAPISGDIVADSLRAMADDQAVTQMIADELTARIG